MAKTYERSEKDGARRFRDVAIGVAALAIGAEIIF